MELSYLLVKALFERNQFLNQKPINVIDCIKAVDGEVRVPRVDSLKRHVLKRFQKVNSFESSILKDLSEKFQYFIQTSMVLAIPATAVKRVLQIKTFYLLLGK